MKSDQALDRAILEIVERQQPVKMEKIVDLMDRLDDHRRGKKSNRSIIERVYSLKREGKLALQGERQFARYVLPGYTGTQQTEAQKQVAEGAARQAQPVVVVEVDPEQPAPEGWRHLHEILSLELIEEEQEQIMQAPRPPAAPEPQPPAIVKRAPLSINISALAADVAAQAAMTVERVVGQDIARYEAQIADLQRENTRKDAEITRLGEELKAAEQLAQEAEQKYNELRNKLRSL